MPFIYIYSPDDFVGGLPSESGAAASGTAPFTLTLKPGATPTLVKVTDDDTIFDEVDTSQVLTNDVIIDGTTYTAGTTINTAYDLLDTTSGHKVTSLHFGGDGYNQGPVNGLVSTVELVPGQSYRFNQERTSHTNNNPYSEYHACFTQGTMILTAQGEQPVESLCPGDLVETQDGGLKPVRLVLSQKIAPQRLAQNPDLRPVRICAGSMGMGVPHRDLSVSPQHRMLVESPISHRMFGTRAVLVAARKLTAVAGIHVDHDQTDVTYIHLVFDDHEIIQANGAPTESFYPGPAALRALNPAARSEIYAIFPQLLEMQLPNPARPIPKGAAQKKLMQRHVKNAKTLLS